MSIGKILVVETETLLAQQLVEQLRGLDGDTTVVPTVAAALECLGQRDCDLVITELTLPDGSAGDIVNHLTAQAAPTPVIVISEFGSAESAIECLRHGAAGYLLKPFSSAQLEVVIAKAEDHSRWVRVGQWLSQDTEPDGGWALLGESAVMRGLNQIVRQVARTDATVLITGENGTGKERVARALCHQSLRSRAPLIKVDCTGGSQLQLVVELFGQENSGTAAAVRRVGRIESANGGTILLDGISDLSPDLQHRLLELLQHQTVQRLGSQRSRRVDVRVLATTSRSLDESVRRGQLREDLYLRLNIVPIHIPPLRDRKTDIPLLAEHFRQQFASRHGSPALAISPECMAALQTHSWPGNVRELKNVLERAVLACAAGNILEPAHLDAARVIASAPAMPTPFPAAPEIPDDLGEIEKRHILAVVAKYGGNRTHATKRLGISIRTLRNKLKQYRLSAERMTQDADVEAWNHENVESLKRFPDAPPPLRSHA